MTTLTMLVPDEASLALKVPNASLSGEIRMAAAIKLFEMGKLSSGAAAALADIPKPLFMTKLADYGVASFVTTEEELVEDVQNA